MPDYNQRKLDEAYWKGVEKARKTGTLENIMDSLANLVVPDSMGTEEYRVYKKGYQEYMTGKIKDNAASGKVQGEDSSASDLEKAWWAICDSCDFIPEERVRYYTEQLIARGKQVALVIGLSAFTDAKCPKCSATGQYKVHFLGELRHSGCGTWHMGVGGYIGFQLSSILHSGYRAAGAVKEEADKKSGSGNWMHSVLAFLFVGIFRAMLAVVLIPLHCIVALLQPGQAKADVLARGIVLGVMLAAFGVGFYEVQHASTQQFPTSLPARAVQVPSSQSVHPNYSVPGNQPQVRPSFDCAKAHTKAELLICRDGRLAGLEVNMVSAYTQALSRLPGEAQAALRREHLAWFKNYARTCNQFAADSDRATCIANFLSSHTSELLNRR